jgi:hypothetical protein
VAIRPGQDNADRTSRNDSSERISGTSGGHPGVENCSFIASFRLFRFASDGFRFFRLYQITETHCFDIEAKQTKQSTYAETSFDSSFGYIEIKPVS